MPPQMDAIVNCKAKTSATQYDDAPLIFLINLLL